MENEQEIMQLIMHGGDARSYCMKAIQAAEIADFEQSDQQLAAAKEAIDCAHIAQTKLIQAEMRGAPTTINLLMVHAQDHVMNAMTIHDLAHHIITTKKEVAALKNHTKELVG